MRRSVRAGRRVSAAPTAAVVLVVAVLALGGCRAGHDENPQTVAPTAVTSHGRALVTSPTSVVVLPTWLAGRDREGLLALLDVLDEHYGGDVRFVDNSATGGPWASVRDREHVSAFPNDVVAVDTELDEGLEENVALGRLRDLSGLASELGLAQAWPRGVFDQLATDGRLYRMPAVVDRTNLLWSNPAALHAAGLDPHATFASVDEWISAMKAVAATGVQPLVLAGRRPHVLLLEDVLLSDLGPAGYRGLWDGTTGWDDVRVHRALGQFQELCTTAQVVQDDDWDEWSSAMDQLIDGSAAFMVLDGQGASYLGEHGRDVGTGIDVQAAPGTADAFAYVVASFAWDSASMDEAGAAAWFEVVSSVDGQSAVAAARGGVPVRTDVDPAPFSDFARSQMSDWKERVPVPSVMVGGPVPRSLGDALARNAERLAQGQITPHGFQARMTDPARR